jgi:hypothetical protein
MTIRQKVSQILRDYPATRNSDKELKKQIGRTFHGLSEEQLRVLDILPDSETIRRNRQFIQNTQGLYRADRKIQVQRKVKRAEFETEFGYHPTGEIGQRIHEEEAKEKAQAKLFEVRPDWS